MWAFFERLLDSSMFSPHGICLLWEPELIWLHVVSDASIAAAYFSIPFALAILVTKRRDLQFGWVFWAFAIFILACGLTHLLSIYTLWVPIYGIEGLVKAATAVASIFTAVALWPLLPKILTIPSPFELQKNAEHLGEQLKGRPDLRQFADDICESGERGAELTQRLLAFSRRQLLQPKAIDCRELLQSMLKLLKRTLRENIEISTGFGLGAIQAFADRAQLESAVLNLALNAQDAMPSGGRLTLSTELAAIDEDYRALHPEVASGAYALISVTDDGEGMTPEVIEHAFEPFFTTKEVGKGSGLGLSMVYGFARQSDGHVSIYSEQALGTTVRIYLPRVGAGQSATETPENDEAAPRGHETILIAEDDPFVRSSVILRVEALGYRVVAAVNGREALQRLRADPGIDMLFTDIVMPGGMSGWELADQARRIRPGLPVLFTSGYTMETLVEQGRVQAQAVVLTKPYRKAELAQRLRDAFAAATVIS